MPWNSLTNLSSGIMVNETHMDQIRENIEWLGAILAGNAAFSTLTAVDIFAQYPYVQMTCNTTGNIRMTAQPMRGAAKKRAAPDKRATELTLGPVSTQWLATLGIHTRDQLAHVGPLPVYALLKANGYNVTINLVYALEAQLRGCHWTDLPDDVKDTLRTALAEQAKPRCEWAGTDALYRRYHDEEWGVPVHDDQKLFEFLILEGAQAGLSWITILRKREAYREAFAQFDPELVARFTSRHITALMNNAGIVRNRLKIASAISNARVFLETQSEFGSFDRYMWRFVNGTPIQNTWPSLKHLPAKTAESDALSKDLKKRGFRFVGSTICYAHMQAVGMVNDHLVHCFRHRELKRSPRPG